MTTQLFDIQASSEQLGSRQAAININLAFLKTLPEFKEKLNSTLQSANTTELKQIVHSTLGATVYCITPRLNHQLQLLNKALLGNEPEQEIRTIINSINITIDLMLKEGLNEL